MNEKENPIEKVIKKAKIKEKLGERLKEIMQEKDCKANVLARQLYKSLDLTKNGAPHAISAFRNGILKLKNIPEKLTRIFVALEVEKDDKAVEYVKTLYPDYEYPPKYDFSSMKGLSLYDKLNFLNEEKMSIIEKAVENELRGETQNSALYEKTKNLTLYQKIKYLTHEIFDYMEKHVTLLIEEEREK